MWGDFLLWGVHQELEDQVGVLEFCDDPAVDAAAKAAMTSFNERVVTGYKMALYQILSANRVERAQIFVKPIWKER